MRSATSQIMPSDKSAAKSRFHHGHAIVRPAGPRMLKVALVPRHAGRVRRSLASLTSGVQYRLGSIESTTWCHLPLPATDGPRRT